MDFIHEDHDTKVLAYQRWYEKNTKFFLIKYICFHRANSGERVIVVVNLSGNFLGKYSINFIFDSMRHIFFLNS